MASEFIPRTSAWRIEQAKIEAFVREGLDCDHARAVYINSSHGAGKSTTLLTHLAAMHLDGKCGPILYVTRESEKSNVVRYIKDNTEMAPHTEYHGLDQNSAVTLCTYQQFARLFCPSPPSASANLKAHTVLLLDVEVRPTVWGELGVAAVLLQASRMKKRGQGISVACLGAHISRRMVKAFEQRLCTMEVIMIEDSNLGIKTIFIKNDNNKDTQIREHIDRVLESRSGRVVVGGCRPPSTPEFVLKDSMLVYDEHTLSSVPEYPARLLAVDACLSASLPLENLQLYVSLGFTADKLFDTFMSQIVETTRTLCNTELWREKSWPLKSDQPLGDVQLLSVASESRWKEPMVADPDGPAWNGDLIVLALRMIQLWPGKGPNLWPIRQPMDTFALSEMVHRLHMLECIEQEKNGYALTKLGELAGVIMEECGESLAIDLHTAVFMASAYAHRGRVGRAILLIGAIFVYAEELCTLPGTAVEDRQALITPVSKISQNHGHKGLAWVLLGFLVQMGKNGLIDSTKPASRMCGVITVPGTAEMAIGLFNRLCDIMSLEQRSSREILREVDSMTDEEVTEVEMEMMRAWMHRTVLFDCEPETKTSQVDCATMQACDVEEEREFLDIRGTKRMDDVKEATGFVSIYQKLRKVNHAQKVYIASGLTRIPQHLYSRLNPHGMPFPECIDTTYPIHIQENTLD
ncbi:hypothetical protein F4809DRAFT_637437 [Biscogniauxia mediterranea]|nr:hypothetical protein F4809DRAFT_637437 [Biscogniauxia mediterranea]